MKLNIQTVNYSVQCSLNLDVYNFVKKNTFKAKYKTLASAKLD